ncbi:MAG: hypothetical protein JJE16_08635 [Nitrospiraceae bacterium]|nr:hypothetical protein [Nitrospiraceae bacterium]
MQTHFFTILPLDETVIAFNAQHFARDHVVGFQLIFLPLQTSLTAFPIKLATIQFVCSRSRII